LIMNRARIALCCGLVVNLGDYKRKTLVNDISARLSCFPKLLKVSEI